MICLLAYTYLAIAMAVQRQREAGSDLDAGLIPITMPELLRLLRDTVIPRPGETGLTGCTGPPGDAATSTAPAKPTSAGMLTPHNAMIAANRSCLPGRTSKCAGSRFDQLCAPGARQNLTRSQEGIVVQAVTVRDRAAGAAGLTLSEIPHPHAAENDVIVRVYAAGFTPGELDWPGTWTDRAGRDRTPSVPGHELSGVVSELGYGTTGLTVGQRVFGLADWTRDGSLAEYTAVEARNLAPLPADIDYTVAAAVPISGLTAWQGLFDQAGLKTGQTVLIHGAAGGVGSMAVQLAHELGSRVIGTGRAADREAALGLGADVFVDLQADRLEEAGEVDVVFDVIGGEVLERSAPLVRAGGTLVTIIGLPKARPADGRAIFFVVEPDRLRLADHAERVRSGRLQPIIGAVRPLAEAPSAFTPDRRMPGKTIIRVTEGE